MNTRTKTLLRNRGGKSILTNGHTPTHTHPHLSINSLPRTQALTFYSHHTLPTITCVIALYRLACVRTGISHYIHTYVDRTRNFPQSGGLSPFDICYSAVQQNNGFIDLPAHIYKEVIIINTLYIIYYCLK